MFVVKVSVRFTLTFILAGQFVLTRRIFLTGHFQLCSWRQNWIFLNRHRVISRSVCDNKIVIGTFPVVFLPMPAHFPPYLWQQVSRHFQLCSWRKITDIYNKMSTHFQTCLSAIKQAFFLRQWNISIDVCGNITEDF